MAVEDRNRWDARHGAVGAAGAAGPMPPDALRGQEHQLTAGGRALDVACGRGAVAVWLALRGFEVDAVDVSGVGLEAGAALAEDAEVGDRIQWWEHDLDDGLPDGCVGPYGVVVCQRFRDPRLYPVLSGVLGPDGLLVVTVLSEVDEGPGPFRAAAGELLAAFGGIPGLVVLDHGETDGEASLLARWVRP